MKNYLFVFFLWFGGYSGYAQTDDELLTKTVNDFLEGGTNGQVDRFKGAFVRDAVQRAVGTSGVIGMTVENLASKIKPNQVMERTTKVLSISYANNAATAITETTYANNKIIDMLNLLKVGDSWKIVSRVYSRVELDEDLNTVGGATTPTAAAKPKAVTTKPKKVVSSDGW